MSNVTTKVAVVDAQAILEQCTKLQAQIDAWRASAEYKALNDEDAQTYSEFKKVPFSDTYIRGALMLMPTEATNRYNAAKYKYDKIHAAFNKKNNAKISSIKQKVKEEIQVAINQVVKERGIGLLLHPNSEILYFDDEVNITDDVKAIYDAQ